MLMTLELFTALSTATLCNALAQLEHCSAEMNTLFCSNGLCLNAGKSEAILLRVHQRLCSFPSVPSVNTASSAVGVSDQITNLGVIIDKYLTFDCHVSEVCKKSFFSTFSSKAHMLLLLQKT